MSEQKIAVLGYGLWGRNIVRNFYNLNALGMVCDLDEENLAKVREQYPGVKTTRDFHDILNSDDSSQFRGIPTGIRDLDDVITFT